MVYLMRIPVPRRPRPLPRLDLRPRLFGPDSGGIVGLTLQTKGQQERIQC